MRPAPGRAILRRRVREERCGARRECSALRPPREGQTRREAGAQFPRASRRGEEAGLPKGVPRTYWMAAVPAAVSLSAGLATLCAVLAGGAYHQQDATSR